MEPEEKPDLEAEKLKAELERTKEDILRKEKEIQSLKKKKRIFSFLIGLTGIIGTAVIGLIGTWLVSSSNLKQKELELKQKEKELETGVIKDWIVPGDTVQSRKNLKFLLDMEIISSNEKVMKKLEQDDTYQFQLKVWNEYHIEKGEVENIYQQISDRIGLPRNFDVESCEDTKFCDPSINGEKRSVVYNPQLIRKMRQLTGSPWPAVFMLAHEAGHHYLGQSLSIFNDSTNNYARGKAHELAAMKFAGFTLARLGASLKETLYVTEIFCKDDEQSNHHHRRVFLGREQYQVVIKNGWENGSEN